MLGWRRLSGQECLLCKKKRPELNPQYPCKNCPWLYAYNPSVGGRGRVYVCNPSVGGQGWVYACKPSVGDRDRLTLEVKIKLYILRENLPQNVRYSGSGRHSASSSGLHRPRIAHVPTPTIKQIIKRYPKNLC